MNATDAAAAAAAVLADVLTIDATIELSYVCVLFKLEGKFGPAFFISTLSLVAQLLGFVFCRCCCRTEWMNTDWTLHFQVGLVGLLLLLLVITSQNQNKIVHFVLMFKLRLVFDRLLSAFCLLLIFQPLFDDLYFMLLPMMMAMMHLLKSAH